MMPEEGGEGIELETAEDEKQDDQGGDDKKEKKGKKEEKDLAEEVADDIPF